MKLRSGLQRNGAVLDMTQRHATPDRAVIVNAAVAHPERRKDLVSHDFLERKAADSLSDQRQQIVRRMLFALRFASGLESWRLSPDELNERLRRLMSIQQVVVTGHVIGVRQTRIRLQKLPDRNLLSIRHIGNKLADFRIKRELPLLHQAHHGRCRELHGERCNMEPRVDAVWRAVRKARRSVAVSKEDSSGFHDQDRT